jgi:hypothetical protein
MNDRLVIVDIDFTLSEFSGIPAAKQLGRSERLPTE